MSDDAKTVSDTGTSYRDTGIFRHQTYDRTFPEILADLHKPIPPRLLDTKRQGGTDLTFIPWHQAVRLMDLYAPGWEGEITNVQMFSAPDKNGDRADLVAVTYRVTINCLDPTADMPMKICRESTGFELFTKQSFGDPFSNAESMAKRRAFAQFGLGLHLYRKEI